MGSTLWQTLTSNGVLDKTINPLEGLTVLAFTGPDCRAFLQGYLTCDTEALGHEPELAALCTLKGRVLANGWAFMQDEQNLCWVVHASLAERVLSFMQKYLAFARTTLSELRDALLLGAADAAGQPYPLAVLSEQNLDTPPRLLPADQWHTLRVQRSLVLLSATESERFLPQMLGLVEAGAIDFEKGCYLGQEVVARAQHRGEVKRHLQRLTATGPCQRGQIVDARSHKPAGEIVDLSGRDALAVVARDADGPFQQEDVSLSFPG